MARDPRRIDSVLAELRTTWMEHPDWRLGQLIVNATRKCTNQDDPFYLEEGAMTYGLQALREDGEMVRPVDT